MISQIKNSGLYSWFRIWFYRLLSLISPMLNRQVVNKAVFGHRLNLSNPQTFIEKLQNISIYDYNKNELVKQCADKYRLRDYVMAQGFPNILIPLLVTYDSIDDVDWSKLPNKFVVKYNFGCGFNYICHNRNDLDIEAVKKQFKKWSRDKSYLDHAEMQYSKIRKVIMVEAFLENEGKILPSDYKVYCFNGVPTVILYIDGRDTADQSAAFFDFEWNYVSSTGRNVYKDISNMESKPVCLDYMYRVSQILSKPFPFVRIDYYIVNEKLYIGEMTFTPAGCIYTSECEVNGVKMGDMLIVD